jgi:hypothetical protein
MPAITLVQVDHEPRTVYEVRIVGHGNLVTVQRFCDFCNRMSQVGPLKREEVDRWNLAQGDFVQDIWPNLSAADREIIISGSHDKCFDSAFPEEE